MTTEEPRFFRRTSQGWRYRIYDHTERFMIVMPLTVALAMTIGGPMLLAFGAASKLGLSLSVYESLGSSYLTKLMFFGGLLFIGGVFMLRVLLTHWFQVVEVDTNKQRLRVRPLWPRRMLDLSWSECRAVTLTRLPIRVSERYTPKNGKPGYHYTAALDGGSGRPVELWSRDNRRQVEGPAAELAMLAGLPLKVDYDDEAEGEGKTIRSDGTG